MADSSNKGLVKDRLAQLNKKKPQSDNNQAMNSGTQRHSRGGDQEPSTSLRAAQTTRKYSRVEPSKNFLENMETPQHSSPVETRRHQTMGNWESDENGKDSKPPQIPPKPGKPNIGRVNDERIEKNVSPSMPKSASEVQENMMEMPPIPPRFVKPAPTGVSVTVAQPPSTTTNTIPCQTNERIEKKFTPSMPKSTSEVQENKMEMPPVPPRFVKPAPTGVSVTVAQPPSTTANTIPWQTKDDCIVTVTGFDKIVTEEGLKLYFENRNKSGGGPVDSVTIIDGAAVVHFKQASDAQNVLGTTHTYMGQYLSVVQSSRSEDVVKNMFVLSGLSKATPHDMLTDFLESKTGYTVMDVYEYQEKGEVMVVFSEDPYLDYEVLKEVCKNNTLNGVTLQVEHYHDSDAKYLEPLCEEDISITAGQMKFIEKYDKDKIQKEMDKHEAMITIDTKEFKVKIKGKALPNAVKCLQSILNDICESELPISMPGIVACLKSEEGRAMISSIEQEERCAIVVHEGTYEVITSIPERCSIISNDSSEADSASNGGSSKSTKGSVDETSMKNLDSEDTKMGIMGEFKIVSCRLVMKKGNLETEDSDCVVNITQSDIDTGDIWSSLSQQNQEDALTQAGMPPNVTRWGRTGTVITSVTGQHFKYIIHVSQKHFKGDLVKTIIKCLQEANKMGKSSVAFFSMGSRGGKEALLEDSPKLLIEAIDKYQKSSKSSITSVRIVQENMEFAFVTAAIEEIHKLKIQRRGLAGRFRARNYSRQSIQIIRASPWAQAIQERSSREQDKKEENAIPQCSIINADVTVYIYSHNTDSNNKAFERLNKFCQEKMPLKKVNDTRIKKFTKKDIKELLSKKVAVVVDIDGGNVEIRGYPSDVDKIYSKLTTLLDKIHVSTHESISQSGKGEGGDAGATADGDDDDEVFKENDCGPVLKGKTGKVSSSDPEVWESEKKDDDNDIFGKFVASGLRVIADDKERTKVKYHIQKLLTDAQFKYLDN